MKYSKTSFRTIYNQFCCFELHGVLRDIAKNYLPGSEMANCILAYGYYDRSAGLSIEILACGVCSDNKYRFFHSNTQVRTHSRIAAVQNIDYVILSDKEKLLSLYKDKLSILANYSVCEEIEYTRSMEFLDSCRHEYNIDDIQVHLIKNHFQVEASWCRIESIKEHSLIGRLLNEPYQDLGVHQDELIEFRVEKTSEGNYICCCYLESNVQ